MIDSTLPSVVHTTGRNYRPRWAVRIDVPVATDGLGGAFAADGSSPADRHGGDVANGSTFDGSPDPTTPAQRHGGDVVNGSSSALEDTATTSADVVSILCSVRRFDHLSNSHLEADTFGCIADWRVLGVDPRVLTSAVITFYAGEADESNHWEPSDADIRFVGIMKRSKRIGGEDQPLCVEVLAHDYTTLFLEAKKFPTDGMPLYSDTVSQAWARVCDHTGYINPENPSEILPSVKALRTRIVFVGGAKDVVIGSAVTGRMKSLGGRVNVDPKSDAWGVWQKTVSMLGLISYIDKDRCVVTTATDWYTGDNPPVFVWGDNIKELVEDRDTTLCGKGLHLQAFDPMTGTQIESFYPPIGDRSIRKHKVSAKKANDQTALLNASDYESQAYPGPSDQATLDAICRSNYEIMAHQELEGRFVTHEMVVSASNNGSSPADRHGGDVANGGGSEFEDASSDKPIPLVDLLGLTAGDAIQLRIDEDAYEALSDYATPAAKIDYLVGLGYDVGLAQVVVANLSGILALAPVYIVKRVNTTGETTEEGGHFTIEVTYCSKIQASGSSSEAA